MTFLANYHIDIGFGQTHGDRSSATGAIDSQIVNIDNVALVKHQQQLYFPSETSGCSGRLCRLWRNLVPSDGESDATHRPSDGSHCILPLRRLLYHASDSCDVSRCILHSPLRRQASFTLCSECGDVYVPLERHVCYTVRRGCSYAVAVYTTPGDLYAFLRPIATCRTLIYV